MFDHCSGSAVMIINLKKQKTLTVVLEGFQEGAKVNVCVQLAGVSGSIHFSGPGPPSSAEEQG